MSNGTWTLTELPPNRKAIATKWCYKLKRDEHGNVVRYKARLVPRDSDRELGSISTKRSLR
jgi:hypothetical protein